MGDLEPLNYPFKSIPLFLRGNTGGFFSTYQKGETFPAIPYGYLCNKHLLFDLVYNPEITVFLEKGNKVGAATKNGHEMLLNQALKSWQI